MERPDALLYSVSFYFYLASFASYILHIALKRDVLGKVGTILMGVGVIPHTIAFGIRWEMKGSVPLANMYEYMGMMAWMVAVGLVYFALKQKNHRIGVFVSPITVMLMVVASLLPSEVNQQLMPALQSTWLAIHVSMAALGSGAFLIAFAASSFYLLTRPIDTSGDTSKAMRRQWMQFLLYWIGVPVVVAILLKGLGILPPTFEMVRGQVMSGSGVTVFAVGSGPGSLYWGRMAIGLGVGMVVGGIVWPIINTRTRTRQDEGLGARFFAVLTISLLLSAVVTGFMIQNDLIRVTPRSYFKIFEFFGPTLVFSWIITPLINWLLLQLGGGIAKIGVGRDLAEDISYKAVAIGYPLYTVGALFAGAIWAEQAWGTWWSWDPKEVGALIIWLFYTGFLHARYQRQWMGDRAAVLVVFGMVMMFISFFGNYFFGGLHSFEVT